MPTFVGIFLAFLAHAIHADNIAVIGAGYSGLTAALEATALGHTVTVFEMNSAPGGRAQKLEKEGFTFDMVPLHTLFVDLVSDTSTASGTFMVLDAGDL